MGTIMNQSPRKHLFCFGLGYSALGLARHLGDRGWRISGTSRDAARAARLRDRGFGAHLFDGGTAMEDASRTLAGVSHILISIPPGRDGDPALAHHGADISGHDRLEWLGYLSTTGVYGDRGGQWVDENSRPAPTGALGRARLEAERGWLDLQRRLGVPVHVFRLAGIYGPGRNQLEALRGGTARRIDKPGQVFSRIHVDDLAAVLAASIARPNAGAIYNVCDDEAAPSQDVVTFAAGLLGITPPPLIPFAEAALSEMARSFYADNKRVRNRRIKSELGVALAYPTYREGLKALMALL